MTMRIAFYLPYLAVGGAEKSTLWMAREIKERGHDVRLIVDRRGGPLDSAFAEIASIRFLDAPRTALAGPALAKAVKEEAPDALVAVMTHNILTAALMKRVGMIRTPLVGWEHAVLSPMRAARGMRGKLEARLIRSLYPVCDKIICVSKGAAEDAIAVCAPAQINTTFVYNPVPSPQLDALSASEQAIVDRLKSPRIVTLGRLNAAKDYRTLMRAFQYVARSENASLLFIGDGEERTVLEAAATGFGLGDKVVFAGAVKNPAPLLAQCDLFVSSSLTESFGIAIVEAMSVGLPIVATDCPTAPREILDGGQYGLLTPVGDAQALARAIRQALQANHDKEALRARAGEFSVVRAADAFLAAIGGDTAAHQAAA
jgi:glycosyltransferase involved in cell wall biosynthesis